jgi:phage terminase large subunit
MQIHLQPTRPQYQYITTQSPFPALVAGFGAGKTEAAVLRSIAGVLMNPNTNRGFYEPTYDLIRMIAWPRFEDLLTQLNVPYKLQKSPLNMISVEGYGNIIFRSMDNPNRIIGYEHADADIDELDTLKKYDAAYVWRQVLARNRQKKNGQNTIGVTTTPEGFKFVYETWKQSPKNGYEIIQAPTASNPYLPDGYIDSLKDIYPSQLLDAYLEGKFVNLTSGTVYSSYNRVAHRSE